LCLPRSARVRVQRVREGVGLRVRDRDRLAGDISPLQRFFFRLARQQRCLLLSACRRHHLMLSHLQTHVVRLTVAGCSKAVRLCVRGCMRACELTRWSSNSRRCASCSSLMRRFCSSSCRFCASRSNCGRREFSGRARRTTRHGLKAASAPSTAGQRSCVAPAPRATPACSGCAATAAGSARRTVSSLVPHTHTSCTQAEARSASTHLFLGGLGRVLLLLPALDRLPLLQERLAVRHRLEVAAHVGAAQGHDRAGRESSCARELTFRTTCRGRPRTGRPSWESPARLDAASGCGSERPRPGGGGGGASAPSSSSARAPRVPGQCCAA
jgi:hypothetical protein